MTHAQAVALAGALVDSQIHGENEDCYAESNPTILRAIEVAAPDLVLTPYTLAAGVRSELPVTPYRVKQIAARKALGAFLVEWGQALIDCQEVAP